MAVFVAPSREICSVRDKAERGETVAKLNEHARRLLSNPNLGFLGTVDADGWPQVTPVWVDVQDARILVNTALGRVKERNGRREPRVALSVAARDNPWDKVDIRGRVVELIEGEEAERHIDRLAKKYLGQDSFTFRAPGERRVILAIEVDRAHEMHG
jgi:PPOX class probable F420-dependent enzyme